MPIFSSTIQDHVSNTMSQPYYRFDGVDDYISIADSDHLSFGDGTNDSPFSVSAWIYCEDASDFYIASKMHAGAADEWVFSVGGGDKLSLYLEDESRASYQTKTAVATTSENTWIHVACTYDGTGGSTAYTGITLYENGTEITNVTYLNYAYTAMENLGATMTIGALTEGNNFSQGSISDVKIYNLELSAAEVKELYSGVSVPYKYKGANQTATATDDGSSAGTFTTSAGVDGLGGITTNDGVISLEQDDAGTYQASFVSLGSLTAGKRYRCRFDTTLTSGVLINARINSATALSTGIISAVTISSNVGSLEYTVATTGTHYLHFFGNSVGVNTFDNMSNTPIGAVAEYDGSGIASDKWFDKSGNDLHGTVDGATVENAPAGADDGLVYETGEWTGVISDGSTSATMSNTTGTYTRTGNVVEVFGYFSSSNIDGISGDVRIAGLPYTSANANKYYSAVSCAGGSGLAITAGHYVCGTVVPNSTYIRLEKWDSTVGITNLAESEWTADGVINIHGTYIIA